MWKIFLGFIWECVVGKDVRPGKALQHHKFRLLMFLVLTVSLSYNYIVTKRLVTYYEAFNVLEQKYQNQKSRLKTLEHDNHELNKIIIEHFKRYHR